MPITTALQTEIKRVSILDEHGQFDAELGKDLIPNDDLVQLYQEMSLCRKLDEVAFKLQRSGRMGTYPQNMGQEATSLGAAYMLDDTDWMVTCYRENCGLFWRGLWCDLLCCISCLRFRINLSLIFSCTSKCYLIQLVSLSLNSLLLQAECM